MNQGNESGSQGLNLPPPEQLPPPVEVETAAPAERTATVEQAPSPSAAAPLAAPSWPSDLPVSTGGMASDDVAATSGSDLSDLDDKDLIDKAVVEKAKAIVNRTAEDPYRQTQEMGALKAEFLQQNYNKVIKLNKQ